MRNRHLIIPAKQNSGFTLVELMIVVVIVAILAAVAMPAYNEHITRTRRSDAETALLDLAARMERYFAENNTYASATIASGNAATDLLSTATSSASWYTISITAQTASAYTLQARPVGVQGTRDTRCQSLTYNSLGQKGVANGPAGAPTWTAAQCWR